MLPGIAPKVCSVHFSPTTSYIECTYPHIWQVPPKVSTDHPHLMSAFDAIASSLKAATPATDYTSIIQSVSLQWCWWIIVLGYMVVPACKEWYCLVHYHTCFTNAFKLHVHTAYTYCMHSWRPLRRRWRSTYWKRRGLCRRCGPSLHATRWMWWRSASSRTWSGLSCRSSSDHWSPCKVGVNEQ